MAHSDPEIVKTESSAKELTFVRPLPPLKHLDGGLTDVGQAAQTGRTEPDYNSSFCTRLFPLPPEQDSGSLPSVTGMQLGHFVIEERIGRGGMGAVFRAIDKRLDRVVALKILSPDLSSDQDAIQRFQNEAKAAAKLDHDNIARVHYIGEENGLHFIAFEFVSGTNVRKFILQKGRIAPSDVVNYSLQIAEALRQTSAANVIHRDIKPSNIIISPTGRAKLVDLGLARHQTKSQRPELTVAGTALGTFDYIAPEQALDARNVDVRSDIYSLGCTMFHMLTGEPPYPSGTVFQKVVNHHGSHPPSPSEKCRNVPPQLSRVVQRMMATNPDERYANADSLVNDLVQIAENFGLQPTSPDTVVWTTPLYKARNPYWDGTRTWMGVALVLLVMVVLVDRLQFDTTTEPANDSFAGVNPTMDGHENSDSTDANGPSDNDQSNETIPETNSNSEIVATIGESTTANSLNSLSTNGIDPDEVRDSSIPETNDSSTVGVIASNSSESNSIVTSEGDEQPLHSTQASQTTQDEVGIQDAPAFFVKTPGAEAIGVYTLASAFTLAEDNSVIEIQSVQPIEIQTEKIRVQNKRVRIRSATNERPVIRFDLSESLSRQVFATEGIIFEIGSGGALEVYGVDLELLIDESIAVDRWSFFKMSAGAELVTKWSSFTINNPNLADASLIEIPDSEPEDISSLMPERTSQRTTRVGIHESFIRGQMDGVVQTGLDPMDLQFDATALNLTGAAYRIDGSQTPSMVMDSDDQQSSIKLEFGHVTAVLGEGLISASCGDHGDLPPMIVDVRNSIFRIEKPGLPLIWIAGHLDSDLLIEKIQWQDHADPNLLVGDNPVCLVDSFAPDFFEPIEVSQSTLGAQLTLVPDHPVLSLNSSQSEESAHLIDCRDLKLNSDPGIENPATAAASDGRDLGVDWSRSQLPERLPNPSY